MTGNSRAVLRQHNAPQPLPGHDSAVEAPVAADYRQLSGNTEGKSPSGNGNAARRPIFERLASPAAVVPAAAWYDQHFANCRTDCGAGSPLNLTITDSSTIRRVAWCWFAACGFGALPGQS